jgi:hypothetical protein
MDVTQMVLVNLAKLKATADQNQEKLDALVSVS